MNKLCWYKKCIIFICLFFIISTLHVFAEETPTLINIVPEVRGNELAVSVEYTSSEMCGGSFNFLYDTAVLRLIAVEEGETIKTATHFINPEFASDAIRVNWVSAAGMPPEGVLVNIRFEILNRSFNKSDISIDKLKTADGEGNKLNAVYNILYDINSSSDSNTGNNYTPAIRPSYSNSSAQNKLPKNDSETLMGFSDVKKTDWFYDNIKFVVENKLMNGVSQNEFAPDNTLTRAMLVTVLYRNEGEPAVNRSISFADVDIASYYANAVCWARQNGIVNGVSENEFAPDNNITREQIAAIMHRYAQYKNYDVNVGESTDIFSYDDAGYISDYAMASMRYVVGSGLMNGKSATTLNPLDYATRAEIAAILQRFIENNK